MNRPNPWSRYWPVWVLPGLLLLANLLWLGGARSTLLGQGSLLEREVERLEQQVTRLEASRRNLQQAEQSLAEVRQSLGTLRGEQLGPMRERLVPFLTEVVRLAQQAGLSPESISYQRRIDEKSGLVYFSARYGLQGDYGQVRRCVALLESSPQFILIEQLGLRGANDAASVEVGISLSVATYFTDLDEQMLKSLQSAEASGGR